MRTSVIKKTDNNNKKKKRLRAFSVVCRQTIRVSVVSVRPLKRKRKKRTKFQPGDLVRRWSLPEVQWHLAPSSWMSEKKKKKTWITKTPMGGIIIRKWKDPGQLLALRAVYDALVTSTSSLPFRRRRVRETRRTRRTMVDLPTAFPENFFFSGSVFCWITGNSSWLRARKTSTNSKILFLSFSYFCRGRRRCPN